MKLSEGIKTYLKLDFAIGILIVAVTWNQLGQEGMARKFCQTTHAEMCDDVDWGDDDGYEETREEKRHKEQAQERSQANQEARDRADYCAGRLRLAQRKACRARADR